MLIQFKRTTKVRRGKKGKRLGPLSGGVWEKCPRTNFLPSLNCIIVIRERRTLLCLGHTANCTYSYQK